jgi:hypothetical protein
MFLVFFKNPFLFWAIFHIIAHSITPNGVIIYKEEAREQAR